MPDEMAALIAASGQGWLSVDKPVGWSSFQVVARVRKQTGVKKVGHAGTLDPFASGVLVVAVGKEFTRKIESVQAQAKGYLVRMVLGIETDTLDPEGRIVSVDEGVLTRRRVTRFFEDPQFQHEILAQWIGEISQIPPRFSAKKINGVPMYAMARKNQEFEIRPTHVRIDSIEVVGTRMTNSPTIDLRIRCGKGTYIRSLVRDVAVALGTVGYAQLLVREFIGDYQLADAISVEAIPCGF